MERLDYGHLHPSIKQPETDMSWPGFEPPTSITAGEHSSKELSIQLILISIQNLYSPLKTCQPPVIKGSTYIIEVQVFTGIGRRLSLSWG
jgi:hypothetical protein